MDVHLKSVLVIKNKVFYRIGASLQLSNLLSDYSASTLV
jgi:hypothetical protein